MDRKFNRRLRKACLRISGTISEELDRLDALFVEDDIPESAKEFKDVAERAWRDLLRLIPGVMKDTEARR